MACCSINFPYPTADGWDAYCVHPGTVSRLAQ
jgi:hypothetical protein